MALLCELIQLSALLTSTSRFEAFLFSESILETQSYQWLPCARLKLDSASKVVLLEPIASKRPHILKRASEPILTRGPFRTSFLGFVWPDIHRLISSSRPRSCAVSKRGLRLSSLSIISVGVSASTRLWYTSWRLIVRLLCKRMWLAGSFFGNDTLSRKREGYENLGRWLYRVCSFSNNSAQPTGRSTLKTPLDCLKPCPRLRKN